MIHFIVATSSESKLIIKKLKLKKIYSSSGFDFFFNDDFSITITGLGKINSALGVAHTFFKFKGLSNNIWINIGLAGHEKEKIGTLVLVDKVYDHETQTHGDNRKCCIGGFTRVTPPYQILCPLF